MKFIKIFIASSIVAFEQEREDLKSYISSLNDTYVKRGIYFEMILCEHLSNAIGKDRKQEEYNAEIRDSQYFYVLLADEIGQYTLEEFNVALKQFQKSGTPRIYAYFRELPEGQPPSDSVQHFLTRLDSELNHYYSRFVHIDSIKLNMLLELTRDPDLNANIQVQDGQVSLNGTPVLSTKNIPIYHRNEELQKRISEKAELDERFAELRIAQIDDPSNDDIFNQLLTISHQRNQLATQIHQMENDILTLCSTICGFSSSGQPLTWREKKAHELLDIGNYDGALSILNDELRQKELAQAEAIVEDGKKLIQGYISENLLKIQTLKSKCVNRSSILKIIFYYKECEHLIFTYNLDSHILLDYIRFLRLQRQYYTSIRVAEKLNKYYELTSISPEIQATLDNLLGALYADIYNYQGAKYKYQKSLAVRRKLVQQNPYIFYEQLSLTYNNLANVFRDTNNTIYANYLYKMALKLYEKYSRNSQLFNENYALICNNLGNLLRDTNQLEEAEFFYREALKIRRNLLQHELDYYKSLISNLNIVQTCNGLATLLWKSRKMREAEVFYLEALEISRNLVEKNFEAFRADLAGVSHNLATLYMSTNQVEKSEKLYREALDIRRQLAKKNPDAFAPDVAATCNRLADLLSDTSNTKEAEKLYREALEIIRKVAKRNLDLFEPYVANVCSDLAAFLWDTGHTEEPESLFREALDIRRQLAKKNPDSFMPDVAEICYDLATFLWNTGHMEEPENLFREALDIRRQLAKKNPDSFVPDVAETCYDLATFLWNTCHMEEPENLFREALDIRRQLAKKDPDSFAPGVAAICNDLAIFLKNIGHMEEPESLFREALDIRRQLAKKDPDSFALDVAVTCYTLANLLSDTNNIKGTEKLYREALEIYQKLAKRNPDVFDSIIVTILNNLKSIENHSSFKLPKKVSGSHSLCKFFY